MFIINRADQQKKKHSPEQPPLNPLSVIPQRAAKPPSKSSLVPKPVPIGVITTRSGVSTTITPVHKRQPLDFQYVLKALGQFDDDIETPLVKAVSEYGDMAKLAEICVLFNYSVEFTIDGKKQIVHPAHINAFYEPEMAKFLIRHTKELSKMAHEMPSELIYLLDYKIFILPSVSKQFDMNAQEITTTLIDLKKVLGDLLHYQRPRLVAAMRDNDAFASTFARNHMFFRRAATELKSKPDALSEFLNILKNNQLMDSIERNPKIGDALIRIAKSAGIHAISVLLANERLSSAFLKNPDQISNSLIGLSQEAGLESLQMLFFKKPLDMLLSNPKGAIAAIIRLSKSLGPLNQDFFSKIYDDKQAEFVLMHSQLCAFFAKGLGKDFISVFIEILENPLLMKAINENPETMAKGLVSYLRKNKHINLLQNQQFCAAFIKNPVYISDVVFRLNKILDSSPELKPDKSGSSKITVAYENFDHFMNALSKDPEGTLANLSRVVNANAMCLLVAVYNMEHDNSSGEGESSSENEQRPRLFSRSFPQIVERVIQLSSLVKKNKDATAELLSGLSSLDLAFINPQEFDELVVAAGSHVNDIRKSSYTYIYNSESDALRLLFLKDTKKAVRLMQTLSKGKVICGLDLLDVEGIPELISNVN